MARVPVINPIRGRVTAYVFMLEIRLESVGWTGIWILFFLDGRHPLADTRHAFPVRRDIGPPLAEADCKFVKYVSKFVVIVASDLAAFLR